MNSTSASLASTPAPPGRGERASASGIAHRRLEPDAGVGAANVDANHRRQPGEQHAREARVAGEVAADQARRSPRRRRMTSWRGRRASTTSSRAPLGAGGTPGADAISMGMALREDHDVARAQAQRRLVLHLDPALALGDEVEDDDALGARLEQRRRRVGRRRLIAPGRGEARLDEDRADQADDAQAFPRGRPCDSGADVFDLEVERERALHRTRHRRAAAAFVDQRAQSLATRHPARRSAPAAARPAALPRRARRRRRPCRACRAVSVRLRARTSRWVSAMPCSDCRHRDRRCRARRQAGAEEPSGRDQVAAAAELGRHVARDLGAVGRGASPRASHPARAPSPARRRAGPSRGGAGGPSGHGASKRRCRAWSWRCG